MKGSLNRMAMLGMIAVTAFAHGNEYTLTAPSGANLRMKDFGNGRGPRVAATKRALRKHPCGRRR